MSNTHTVFKELESDEPVPEYLKKALVSEVDIIRNSMHVVTHFTEHLLKTMIISISLDNTDSEEAYS